MLLLRELDNMVGLLWSSDHRMDVFACLRVSTKNSRANTSLAVFRVWGSLNVCVVILILFPFNKTRQYEEKKISKTDFLPLSLVLLFGHCSRLMSRKEKAKKAIVVRQEDGRKRGHSMPPLSPPPSRNKTPSPYIGEKEKENSFFYLPSF